MGVLYFERGSSISGERYELYVRKENLDNIIKIREVLKEDERSISEFFYKWIVEGFNKYMQDRGRLSVLQQHENIIEKEAVIMAEKNKLYLHMWSEFYKSKVNPKETKHIDNVVKFANDLGEMKLVGKFPDNVFSMT